MLPQEVAEKAEGAEKFNTDGKITGVCLTTWIGNPLHFFLSYTMNVCEMASEGKDRGQGEAYPILDRICK